MLFRSVDTASEIATAVGITATGTILAALVKGSITSGSWTPTRVDSFETALTIAGLTITAFAVALVALGIVRARHTTSPSPTTTTTTEPTHV